MLKAKATGGLRLITEAIAELLSNCPEGLTNSQIARELGLESDYRGHHKGYLSWTVLGLMLNTGHVGKRGRRYILPENRPSSE